MISNLLINAIQNGSGEHFTITTKSDDTFVLLEVHNTGPAISDELLATMFDPLVAGATSIRTK
jgi:signal transduction histidine kinase